MKYLFILFLIAGFATARAQSPDSVYMPNIASAKLFLKGNQYSYPILTLGGSDRMTLDFDDLDADSKQYYYTYQLCNADWTPVDISSFDYIRGFAQNQITDYRYSSVALIRYTHYHISLPEANTQITAAGNYMLKVYINNDTSQLAFTKRLLVVQSIASVTAQLLVPGNPQQSGTHQKLQFTVNTNALSITNPFQQIHVVVLQNNRWDNAIFMGDPSFYSGSSFVYNSDDVPVFPGGNQWRWADLQSFHFQSDRIAKADYLKNGTVVTMKPDKDRSGSPYHYISDNYGKYSIQTTDLISPNYQGDYARVRFEFDPPDHQPLEGKDMYLLGEFTGYKYNNSTKMVFDPSSGKYEGSALMKMGFYNYCYVTLDNTVPGVRPSFEFTEGNHFEAVNNYDILVYYRPLGGRFDQLVAVYSMNTMNGTTR
jgi:hypothetical protein